MLLNSTHVNNTTSDCYGINSCSGIITFKFLIVSLFLSSLLWGCSQTPTKLKWHQEKNYRWASVQPLGFPDNLLYKADPIYFSQTGFKQLPSSKTGIDFENTITQKEIAQNRQLLNGSGVAAGDINGDGLVDLYFCNLNGPNKLYENMGHMRFKDITKEAGVAHLGFHSTGAVFADVDGDGDLDLIVSSLGQGNVIYLNDGKGHFTLDKHSGLTGKKGSMTMTLADINGDGLPDLYIANYKVKTVKDRYKSKQLAQKKILRKVHTKHGIHYELVPPFDKQYKIILTKKGKLAGVAETGEKDELYINHGNGTFKKVTDTRKVFLNAQGKPEGLHRDWGLTAKFYDLNNDGLPDLYVCNDFFSPDRVWINQGNGTFKAIKWSDIRNSSYSSMAAAIGDINDDGRPDIFVTEMLSPNHKRHLQQMGADDPMPYLMGQMKTRPQYNRNSLYLQRKDGTFAEISYLSGVEATGWSWAAKFMDVNLDGYQDIIVNTGYLKDILDLDTQEKMMNEGLNLDDNYGKFIQMAPPLKLTNKIFENNGNLTFTDKSAEWGFTKPDISQGMATADLNNDGVLDIISNRLNEKASIYENVTTAPRIEVRLKGLAPNTQGIGARVKLIGGTHVQYRQIICGGDYLSGSEPVAMFAANKPGANYTLIVKWRDGFQTKIDNVRANRIYEIDEPEHAAINVGKSEEKKSKKPLFKDVSSLIGYRHHEDNFPDFKFQPLLPIKLSKLDPGVAWIDLNNNGLDDFFEATGEGGKMGAYENMGNGIFRLFKGLPFDKIASADQTAIVGWNTDEGTNLFVGNSNYEGVNTHAPSVFRYLFKNGKLAETDSLPGSFPTTGPLAAADYNDDGYVDLFVGGRFIPMHYPMNVSSMFFKNENGKFVPDRVNNRVVHNIGLVTGAVFTDYNQDGYPDLLLSRAWGSLVLLENDHGIFKNVTASAGLAKYKGWWNSVATGDFNNDGYPDIIATNWGLNSPYQMKNGKPLRMYYADFNGNGSDEIIMAYANKKGDYVPARRLDNYTSIPAIRSQIRNNKQFANATLKSIFRYALPRVPYKEINTLKTMIFINNKKGGFTAYSLPQVVQFTASLDATVADFNNDGNEDIFLGQNFFDMPAQFPRLDAGRGLILLGDGKGHFTSMTGSESGIKIYGEQKGAAVADFNGDGKVDLAVAQNGGLTKIYLNQTKKTGLRVRLVGTGQNISAIGASIRLVYENGSKGPLREIQAGSGYWSQNSTTQVMGMSGKVKSIEVQWPDGTSETVPVKPGRMNYVIHFPGKSN